MEHMDSPHISNILRANQAASSSAVHSDISRSIGTETPMSILSEIRTSTANILVSMDGAIRTMSKMCDALETMNIESRQRHTELCAAVLALVDRLQGQSHASDRTPQSPDSGPQHHKSTYYFGGKKLSSSTQLLGCVLYHMDRMLLNAAQFCDMRNTDNTYIDISEWCSIVKSVIPACKTMRPGIRLPRPSDADFRTIADIVASKEPERRPMCSHSHVRSMFSTCQEFMVTVRECIDALLLCPGTLSPERYYRFSALEHPYIDASDELIMKRKLASGMPLRSTHERVRKLGQTQREIYARKMVVMKEASSNVLRELESC